MTLPSSTTFPYGSQLIVSASFPELIRALNVAVESLPGEYFTQHDLNCIYGVASKLKKKLSEEPSMDHEPVVSMTPGNDPMPQLMQTPDPNSTVDISGLPEPELPPAPPRKVPRDVGPAVDPATGM